MDSDSRNCAPRTPAQGVQFLSGSVLSVRPISPTLILSGASIPADPKGLGDARTPADRRPGPDLHDHQRLGAIAVRPLGQHLPARPDRQRAADALAAPPRPAG